MLQKAENFKGVCVCCVRCVCVCETERDRQRQREESERRKLWGKIAYEVGEGNGNPLQYSCLRNPMDKGSLAGYSPWGHKESDRTE